jgi:hypothetical protein
MNGRDRVNRFDAFKSGVYTQCEVLTPVAQRGTSIAAVE